MAASIDTSSIFWNKKMFWPCMVSIFIVLGSCCFAQLASDGLEDTVVEDVVKEARKPDVSVDQKPEAATDEAGNKDFYSFSVKDHNGQLVSLEKYRNKVVLVVNVASECGFTDGHYKALIRMRNILGTEDKFEVLAFPCNQFGAQEPGSNEDIQTFVRDIYHVNFPVYGKIDVLGEDVPDFYRYLIDSAGETPNWNFWKYLVNDKGHVVKAWGPRYSVEDVFHEVKEVIDNIGFDQPSYKKRYSRTEGEL